MSCGKAQEALSPIIGLLKAGFHRAIQSAHVRAHGRVRLPMLALKQCFLNCVLLSPQTLLIGMPSFQALAAILLKADSLKKNTYF